MAARAPRRRRVPLAASPRPSADVDATSLALQLEHRLLLTLGALDIANDGRAQAEGVAEDLRAQNALLVDRLRAALDETEALRASALHNLAEREHDDGDTATFHLANPITPRDHPDDETTGELTATLNPDLRRLRRAERKRRIQAVITRLNEELDAARATAAHDRTAAAHTIELLNQLVAAQDSQIRQLQQRIVEEHHQHPREPASRPHLAARNVSSDSEHAVEEHELTALLERADLGRPANPARPSSASSAPFDAPVVASAATSPRSEPSPTPSPSHSRRQPLLDAGNELETAKAQLAQLQREHSDLISAYHQAERLAFETSIEADRLKAHSASLERRLAGEPTPAPSERGSDGASPEDASIW